MFAILCRCFKWIWRWVIQVYYLIIIIFCSPFKMIITKYVWVALTWLSQVFCAVKSTQSRLENFGNIRLPFSFQTKYSNWRSRKLSNAKHTKHSLCKGEGWPGRMWKATKWSLLAVLTGKSHKTTKGWNQAARLT